MSYKTKYHRDGTVTVWDVYQQQWVRRRAAAIVAESERNILPTLPEADRVRIVRMAENA